MDIGNLDHEVAWRLHAIGFVRLEKIVAKGLSGGVEYHRNMSGPCILEQLEQHPDEAISRIGRQST